MPSTVKIKHQSIGLAICARLAIIIFSSNFQLAYCIQNVLRVSSSTPKIEMGGSHAITCRVHNFSSPEIWWSKGGANLTHGMGEVTLEFKEFSLSDISEYTCYTTLSSGETFNYTQLLSFEATPKITTSISEDIKRGQTVQVTCNVTGYPLKESIHWTFKNRELINSSNLTIYPGSSNLTHRFSSLKIINVTDENNGTYFCHLGDMLEPVQLKVLSAPSVRLDVIKAVGESNIFVNWTLKDGNSRLTDLILSYKKAGKDEEHKVDVDTSTTSYILKNLSALTQYTGFEIRGTNDIGTGSDKRNDNITTLESDPSFVPSVSVKGVTTVSVTLGWQSPQQFSEFYHYYNVTARSLDGQTLSGTAYENSYLVTNLQPGKKYLFQVQACSSFTNLCDGFSAEESAETMEGKSSAPLNIMVNCTVDEKTREYSAQVSWDAPSEPRGEVKYYQVTLNGEAEYVDGFGVFINETVSMSQKTVLANQNNNTLFTGLAPNTNYTVRICAKTRTQCGEVGIGTCSTPVTTPGVEELSKANWSSVRSKNHPNQVYFMVSLPSISQRNGPICCFRVVVVRLHKRETVRSLKPPNQMDKSLRTYDEVHNSSETSGAYVAEMLNSSSFLHITSQSQKSLKIIIGDEEYAKDDKRSICHKCWPSSEAAPGSSGLYRKSPNFSRSDESGPRIKKRHAGHQSPEGPFVKDGPLDSESVYTAYLDAIILGKDKEQRKAHSPYFDALQPKLVQQSERSSSSLLPGTWGTLGMLIMVGLIVVLLVAFMALMCVMRWRRKEPGDQEYNGLSHSIQQLCRRFRGQQLIPHITPDQPPISKDQLVPAYQERHENADLMFQKEFEDLPDRFRDRTADASEKNSSKNRYPDIKAYDQTRVKLSTADGGSDYINANIVVGYKERKKFICAQGPMESTVVDWWRMIWEQRVHLLLMLTNIEEYSKTKCAKYWPSEGSNEYGNITVTHTSEKRYSDYLVRSLKLRLNGPDGDSVKEEREVEQYHYLVWKDYMAPEHPVGIIRFIKRFNEVYSLEKGPILVHCSAGVGRTGTLVALDSLLQQLNEESCVSIFNTICDLRHSRNYLVQSLKQYIFIYRALMEAALFGDTEVPVSELKTQIEKLKSIPEGRTVTRIQEEFEKLSQVVEDRKPFSAGSSDENRHRNRHENVIPYDRNRVILSPMPGLNKEICTYINASFIEGYDSSEQYIIAQDPLEITVGDFWRMIVEHNVRSVVMLSEVGEDKCPRYWPEKDQETSHDYIRVKYMQSQSFPFYYRREFTVTNSKAEDSCLVTQFQYNGWPVGEMAVPESTRGIVELIDTTFKHRETLDKTHGPTLIHCSAGADRSCIFVALAILVRQMMTESRVDVFSVVRKLRSQRQGLFQNLAQYDFIYRGLQIYADLHVANGNASH